MLQRCWTRYAMKESRVLTELQKPKGFFPLKAFYFSYKIRYQNLRHKKVQTSLLCSIISTFICIRHAHKRIKPLHHKREEFEAVIVQSSWESMSYELSFINWRHKIQHWIVLNLIQIDWVQDRFIWEVWSAFIYFFFFVKENGSTWVILFVEG